MMENNCLQALNSTEVKKTVDVLLKSNAAEEKNDLLAETNVVRIQFTFKKIPKMMKKTILFRLPHSVRRPGEEVCLFVKDLDRNKRDYEDTEDHFRTLLESKGVTGISHIIPMKALKLEYKPFEAKRNLSNLYDLYLADERIIRLLPSLLGKSFYSRKRNPMQVNLTAKNLKKEIEKTINSSRCIITGRGASNAFTVGHTDMKTADITQNIMEAVSILASKVPGGVKNIKSLYIRTGGGKTSLPLYVSFDSGDDVELPVLKRKRKDVIVDEISSLNKGKVLITPVGDVEVISSDEDIKEAVQKLNKRKRMRREKAKGFKKIKNPKKKPAEKSVKPTNKTQNKTKKQKTVR